MNTYMIPLAIGAPQIVLIVVVVLLLFGGKKIPELMKGLGGGIKEFKKASQEETKTTEDKNIVFGRDLKLKTITSCIRPLVRLTIFGWVCPIVFQT